MKKLIFLSLILGLTFVLFAPQAIAKKPAKVAKVDICHLIKANDVVYGFYGVVDLYFGRVINVSENALAAHEAHGDSTLFSEGQGPIDTFRGVGYKLPNANCWVAVPIEQ